jgi:hypothetical protein
MTDSSTPTLSDTLKKMEISEGKKKEKEACTNELCLKQKAEWNALS